MGYNFGKLMYDKIKKKIVIKNSGLVVHYEPEQPIVLPANTLRLKFEPINDLYTESVYMPMINKILNKSTSYTIVDAENHIYDWTRNDSDWSGIFANYNEY